MVSSVICVCRHVGLQTVVPIELLPANRKHKTQILKGSNTIHPTIGVLIA